MSFSLYTNSKDTWQALIEILTTATRSIYIELYALVDDTREADEIINICCEKSKNSVQVIIILDAFGSMRLSKSAILKLQSSRVEVRFFRHWLHRTHKKLTIVDGSTALLGGVNVTRQARAWHDLHVSLSGPILSHLVKSFKKTYTLTGGKQVLLEKSTTSRRYRLKTYIIDHTPISRRSKLKPYYIEKISSAQKKVSIVTPYFFTPLWLEDLIKELPKRSIEVELLIPSLTDHPLFDISNRYFASRLALHGVSVYFSPTMNHAKALLIDDTQGMIGSGNIDSFSFKRNSELGIFFYDKKMIKELSDVIARWKVDSIPFSSSKKDMKWYMKIIGFIIKTIRPML